MISSWWGDGVEVGPLERASSPSSSTTSARPPISETQDMLNAMSSLLARLNKPQVQDGDELKGLSDEFTFRWQTFKDAGGTQDEQLRRELNSARNHELELARELLQLRQMTAERDSEMQAALSAAAHDEILELQRHNQSLEMHMAEMQSRDIPLSRCLGELNDALRRELADKTKENLVLQQSMQGLAAQVTDLEGMFVEVMHSRPDQQSTRIAIKCSACSGPLRGNLDPRQGFQPSGHNQNDRNSQLRLYQAQPPASSSDTYLNDCQDLLNLRNEQVESYMATVAALSTDLEFSRNRAVELMRAAETSDAHLANSEQDVERIKSKATELEQLVQKHGSRLAELEKELQRSHSSALEQEELVVHHEQRAMSLDEQLKVQRTETAMYRSRSSFLSAWEDGVQPDAASTDEMGFEDFETHCSEVKQMANIFRQEISSVKQATSEAHAAREEDLQYAAAITEQLEEHLRYECSETFAARDEAQWLREELRIKQLELSRLNNSEVNAHLREQRAPSPAVRKVTFSTSNATGSQAAPRRQPTWEAEDAATVQERLRQRICDLTSNRSDSLPSSQQNSVTSQVCMDMAYGELSTDVLARSRYQLPHISERPIRPENAAVQEKVQAAATGPSAQLSQVSTAEPILDSPLLSQTSQPQSHEQPGMRRGTRTPPFSSPLQETRTGEERGSSILDGLTKLYAAGAAGAAKKAGLPPALPQQAAPKAATSTFRVSSPTASLRVSSPNSSLRVSSPTALSTIQSGSVLRGVQNCPRALEPGTSPAQRPREVRRTSQLDPGTPPAPRGQEAITRGVRKLDPGTPPTPQPPGTPPPSRGREATPGTPPSPLIRCPSFHKDIREDGDCFAARTAAALSSIPIRASSLTARFGDNQESRQQDAVNESDSTQPAWRTTVGRSPAARPPVSTTPIQASPVMSKSGDRVLVIPAMRMQSTPASLHPTKRVLSG